MIPTHDPAWLEHARKLLGTHEAPGAANSPVILGWAKALDPHALGIAYDADSLPWCGLFAAHCLAAAHVAPPPIAVRASAWASWGQDLRPDRLAPGAVLVLQRPGGGHVGFYLGEDARSYCVLGGNQSDAVSIARIAKARCIARRWPAGEPVLGRPRHLAAAALVSRNEA